MNDYRGKTKEEIEALKAIEMLKNDPEYMKTGVISGKSPEELEKERTSYIEKSYKAKVRKQRLFNFIFILILLGVLSFLGYKFYNDYYSPVEISPYIDMTSPHYINNLYQSNNFFFEKHLNPDEKAEYLNWLKSIKRHDKNYYVNYDNFKSKTKDEVLQSYATMYQVMLLEHPELFYYKGYNVNDQAGPDHLMIENLYSTNFKFIIDLKTRRLERELARRVKKFKARNNFQKLKEVYDNSADRLYMLEHEENDSVESALSSRKRTTCRSIAMMNQMIFQRLDIKSYLAYGMLYENPRSFNVIALEDGYYFFDNCVAINMKNSNKMEDYESGILLFNTYDYDTGFYDLRDEELGTKYKYRKVVE